VNPRRHRPIGKDQAYDVVVVGSGFGGSVSALRLVEKGYRVAVIEAGRRFDDQSLPKTSWDIRRFIWAPKLGLHGIQRIHLLKDVVVLAGAGVGGGSLVYANTLYEPPPSFFEDPQWRHITDWRAELAPFYRQARKMLGVVSQPSLSPADQAMRAVADQMGAGHTFVSAPVGVFFGREGRQEPGRLFDDPYFGGAGPARRGCVQCGECMTGCRHGAKNRLDKNYLALAERGGAIVHPDTTVVDVRPSSGGGYQVGTLRTGSWGRRTPRVFHADEVVFAAGTWGTQQLLHRLRDKSVLPALSARLGHLTRTNSESLVGATTRRGAVDYSQGVAITSSWYADANTHIEPVRYGHGSNLMGLLATVMTDGGEGPPRWVKAARIGLAHPRRILGHLWVRHWSERTVIALVMQNLDNSIVVFSKRGWFGRTRLSSKQGHGSPNPTWIPLANEAVRRLAKVIDGEAAGSISELVNIPMTAHFIGGCVIGDSPDNGVLDPYQRVYGYPGLHVVDGSAISANLGVNPSLSITALAERAMAFWPNRGQPDPRPPLGAPYQRLSPVTPLSPMVPAAAPAALSL
jgi:cholesterol oxidase